MEKLSKQSLDRAYKKLAKEVHPDMDHGNAEAFIQLGQAYHQILHELGITRNSIYPVLCCDQAIYAVIVVDANDYIVEDGKKLYDVSLEIESNNMCFVVSAKLIEGRNIINNLQYDTVKSITVDLVPIDVEGDK